MPGALACVLSYGLTCAPGEVVEVPPATPLEPAEAGDSPDPDADDGGGAEPARGEASLLLAQVQKYYDDTADMTASFTQTYVHPIYGTKKVSKGKLKVKKPGKMVWDYDEAEAADVWVAGKSVKVVEHDTRQIISKDVGSSDFAGAEKFLFGGSQLIDDFQVKMASANLDKRYGLADHAAIQLKPVKKSSHYTYLLLMIDESTGRVDAFVVLNADNSTNRFVLSAYGRNKGLSDADFTFKKPAGFVEIKG
jgi:outer membrane lipoprotein carrier protein